MSDVSKSENETSFKRLSAGITSRHNILRHQIHSECEQKVTGELSVVVRVRSEWAKLKLSRSRFRPPLPDDSHHHHYHCCPPTTTAPPEDDNDELRPVW